MVEEATEADWLDAVSQYIRTLGASLDATSVAADRSTLEAHLARAARLVAILATGGDAHQQVVDWFAAEDRAFGWGYLSGPEGERATDAFVELKNSLVPQR